MSNTAKVSIAVWLIIAAGWFFWQRRSESPLEAIEIADGVVTVRNQTNAEWQHVRIWVNEHYAGEVRSIVPGGFVRESLSRFVTAGNVTFDALRLKVNSVVVIATEVDGTRVRIPWGKPVLH